jgi:hypothetical protein
MAQPDPPVVCALTPEALDGRRREMLSDLLNMAEGRDAIPDGIRLRFAAASETLSVITRAVEAERHCCRFLRFSITVEPDNGPIVLELSGPRGTGDFLVGLFDQ